MRKETGRKRANPERKEESQSGIENERESGKRDYNEEKTDE